LLVFASSKESRGHLKKTNYWRGGSTIVGWNVLNKMHDEHEVSFISYSHSQPPQTSKGRNKSCQQDVDTSSNLNQDEETRNVLKNQHNNPREY
jgi:hypothetical protein